MDNIRIDRLALKLLGLTEAQGRHLAMLVTQGLAAARPKADAAAEQPAIRAASTNNEDLDLLSDRVVAQILRQIERAL